MVRGIGGRSRVRVRVRSVGWNPLASLVEEEPIKGIVRLTMTLALQLSSPPPPAKPPDFPPAIPSPLRRILPPLPVPLLTTPVPLPLPFPLPPPALDVSPVLVASHLPALGRHAAQNIPCSNAMTGMRRSIVFSGSRTSVLKERYIIPSIRGVWMRA